MTNPITPNNASESFTQGWALVKACNEALTAKNYVAVRQHMAAYFQLGISRPGNLHSAILSIAVKLATLTPDFRLVPFLNIWDLAKLRPEDSDARVGEDGKRIPSIVERLAKSYAYALLFHPEERIAPALESHFFPYLQKKGYVCDNGPKVVPLLAIRIIQKDVRGRKMTFVSLISQDGTELIAEVHTLTAFQRLRYDDILGMVFDTLLRTSEDKGNLRIEAAIPTKSDPNTLFPTKVGYVEHIDLAHHHIHVYDNESRHMVAENSRIQPKVGDYIIFTPIIPKTSTFKTAFIRSVLSPQDGPASFGLRKAKVTYMDSAKGYSAWELLPSEDGTIHPIIETGILEPSFTKGYINQSVATTLGKPLPPAGAIISILVFLKRGKDRQKRPYVIYFE